MTPCPDSACDGTMEHFARSIRWRCNACKRCFDFVLATAKTPRPVPVRADRRAEVAERRLKGGQNVR